MISSSSFAPKSIFNNWNSKKKKSFPFSIKLRTTQSNPILQATENSEGDQVKKSVTWVTVSSLYFAIKNIG